VYCCRSRPASAGGGVKARLRGEAWKDWNCEPKANAVGGTEVLEGPWGDWYGDAGICERQPNLCLSRRGLSISSGTYRCEISRTILFCSACGCIQQVLPPLAVQRCSCRFNREFTTVQTVAFSDVSTPPPFMLRYASLGQTLISRTRVLPRMTSLQGCKRCVSIGGRAREHAW
jgi:hypothetical protein